MYLVHVTLNNKTVYAIPFKTKKAATTRYNKARGAYVGDGWNVELKTVAEDANIIKDYYINQ